MGQISVQKLNSTGENCIMQCTEALHSKSTNQPSFTAILHMNAVLLSVSTLLWNFKQQDGINKKYCTFAMSDLSNYTSEAFHKGATRALYPIAGGVHDVRKWWGMTQYNQELHIFKGSLCCLVILLCTL